MPKRKKHRGLSDAERRTALEGFARFKGAAAIMAKIGRPVRERTVRAYNCDVAGNRSRLASKWVRYFDEARACYLDSMGSVDIAHAVHRMHLIRGVMVKAQEQNDGQLLLKAIEAARKESDDYTQAQRNLAIYRIKLEIENERKT